MTVILAYDAIHANIGRLPKNSQNAGYTTGSSDIKWTTEDWSSHPNAIRICQDNGSDPTADVLDSETGAATPTDCAIWAPKAIASYRNAGRIGQRSPAIYASASKISNVVNALNGARIKSGIGLWIANWNDTQIVAANDVANAAGPFPIIGIQFRSAQSIDFSVFSEAWLNGVSKVVAIPPVSKPEMPPGQWNDPSIWNWKQATISGIGQDGLMHMFLFDQASGKWIKLD